MKFMNAARKYAVVSMSVGMSCLMAAPAFATESEPSTTATLTDTLTTFSSVFAWFLERGGELLSWMLNKPIILLALSIFFVGAVVGMLSRIYNAF